MRRHANKSDALRAAISDVDFRNSYFGNISATIDKLLTRDFLQLGSLTRTFN